jgi:hypothetical protein
MSQNSSNKRRLRDRFGRVAAAIALPAWAYVSVFVLSSSVVSFFLAGLFEQTGINARHVDMSLLVVIASTLTYLVGLAIMLIEPYVLRGRGVDRHDPVAVRLHVLGRKEAGPVPLRRQAHDRNRLAGTQDTAQFADGAHACSVRMGGCSRMTCCLQKEV